MKLLSERDIIYFLKFGMETLEQVKNLLYIQNLCGRRIMAITRASQARDVSSILIARSLFINKVM